jgi:hypothetical protein
MAKKRRFSIAFSAVYCGRCAKCGEQRRRHESSWQATGRPIPHTVDDSQLPYYDESNDKLCNPCFRLFAPKQRRVAVATTQAMMRADVYDRLTSIRITSSVCDMYTRWNYKTRELSGSDAFTASDVRLYSPFVSTGFGELTMCTMHTLLAFLRQHMLTHRSHFLDIGMAYGRAVMHVGISTGAEVTGVEVVRARVDKATELLRGHHTSSTAGIHFIHGDITEQLPLIFGKTHVLMFDYVFPTPLKRTLMHLLSHIAGNDLQIVLTCINLKEQRYGRWEQIKRFSISFGKQHPTLFAYKMRTIEQSQLTIAAHLDEDGSVIVIRACREIRCGECIIAKVDGEVISDSYLYRRDDAFRRSICSSLIRIRDSAFHRSRKLQLTFLQIWDVSRFIRVDKLRANAAFVQPFQQQNVQLIATVNISAGDRLVLGANQVVGL